MNEAIRQGFIQRCNEYGVDPNELIKYAQSTDGGLLGRLLSQLNSTTHTTSTPGSLGKGRTGFARADVVKDGKKYTSESGPGGIKKQVTPTR